jgi:hypothetical protein
MEHGMFHVRMVTWDFPYLGFRTLSDDLKPND